MKFFSFDIEIADEFELKAGEDILKYAPFHISVAATLDSDGQHKLWYSSGENEIPQKFMDKSKARALLEYMRAIQESGSKLFSWNGLGFDLRWIGYNAGDMELAAKVALHHYDPMFQFYNQRGFPISLEAVGQSMGIRQKKLMSASEAPREWQAGNFKRVMDYVLGDCQITNQIIAAIAREGGIRWITKRGQRSWEPMRAFKTVGEVLREPEPDQSWMIGGGLKRSQFCEWIPKRLIAEYV